MAFFPGEPVLASCPVNSPSFIPKLRILLGLAFVLSLTQSHQVFFGSILCPHSFSFPCHTFDPVIISFTFNMTKPSQRTVLDHQTD